MKQMFLVQTLKPEHLKHKYSERDGTVANNIDYTQSLKD
jgi:hypothetical protein